MASGTGSDFYNDLLLLISAAALLQGEWQAVCAADAQLRLHEGEEL